MEVGTLLDQAFDGNVELDEDGKVCGIEIFQTSSETTLPPTGISWI